jgi:hypothetical protein
MHVREWEGACWTACCCARDSVEGGLAWPSLCVDGQRCCPARAVGACCTVATCCWARLRTRCAARCGWPAGRPTQRRMPVLRCARWNGTTRPAAWRSPTRGGSSCSVQSHQKCPACMECPLRGGLGLSPSHVLPGKCGTYACIAVSGIAGLRSRRCYGRWGMRRVRRHWSMRLRQLMHGCMGPRTNRTCVQVF